jgi:hypothetical protein
MVLATLLAPRARAQTDLATIRARGMEVHQEIEGTLRKTNAPFTSLYAERATLSSTQTGGVNNRAFVWPLSTQFRVFTALVEIDPTQYTNGMRQFSDQVHTRYWRTGETAGNTGYRCCDGPSGDVYYDDNGHMVIALAEAYQLTGDPVYLTRAINTQAYVMSGEDDAAGGGIYFRQGLFTSKDIISTLQGARGAVMLYNITGQQSYLDDALRLTTWARTRAQLPNGLFNQRVLVANNAADGVDLVNSAGVGISLHLDLHTATGDAAYLTEALRIANSAQNRWFAPATGSIGAEGYWAYELVDAYVHLHDHTRNPIWLNRIAGALSWLHDVKRDPNGRYGFHWGNSPQTGPLADWGLNEMASVARAYLYTSTAFMPGDVNQDGVISMEDLEDFKSGWLTNTSAMNSDDRIRAGDLNLDGITNINDFVLLRRALNTAGVTLPPNAMSFVVPEPSSFALLALVAAPVIATRRRRRENLRS